MKKLLVIALAVIAFGQPIQSMEKLRSWLGFSKKIAWNKHEADQICPICYDNLKTIPQAPITQLPCHPHHVFHTDCINLWKNHQLTEQGKATCPYCQKSYSKTIKADLIPSLSYTACMLLASWHSGPLCTTFSNVIKKIKAIELEYKDNSEWYAYEDAAQFIKISATGMKWGTKCMSIPAVLAGTNVINSEINLSHPRTVAVTATALFLGYKYMEHYSHIFNNETPYAHRLAMMLPLAAGYYGASKLLKYK